MCLPLLSFGFSARYQRKALKNPNSSAHIGIHLWLYLDEHQRRLNKFDGRICPRYVWISAAALEFESGGIFSVNNNQRCIKQKK
jgi:hypothetical protein